MPLCVTGIGARFLGAFSGRCGDFVDGMLDCLARSLTFKPRPAKAVHTPMNCMADSTCPNMMTEKVMVKTLRIVVSIAHTSAPKLLMV